MDPQIKQLVATVSAGLAGMGLTSEKKGFRTDAASIASGAVPALGAMWLYGAGGEKHAPKTRDQLDPYLFPLLAGTGLYGAIRMFAPKKEKQTALLSAASLAVLAWHFNRSSSPTALPA